MADNFKELDPKEMDATNGGSSKYNVMDSIKDAIYDTRIGKFVKRLYGWL
ncbi:hypothetical protein [Ruminococcus sp.]|nr:hypothetical protein [Ruminococcus sp.]